MKYCVLVNFQQQLAMQMDGMIGSETIYIVESCPV